MNHDNAHWREHTPIDRLPETEPYIQIRDACRAKAARRARLVGTLRVVAAWTGVTVVVAAVMMLWRSEYFL